MLFKTGIEPKWEDEQNKDGGKWTLETSKQYKIQLDASWLEERDLILFLIPDSIKNSFH